MADIEKGLPVRTVDDEHDYVRVKIFDPTTGTQSAEVDSDDNLHIEMHGNDPTGSDVVMRLGQLGQPNPDGDYDVTNNTKPASVGLIAHDRDASIDETKQNKRVTAVAYGTDNVVALDVAIRDESGAPYSQSNPLPVSFEESEGDEVHDYNTAAAVAANGGTSNHDYSVAENDVFLLEQILAACSSRGKFELQIGDGADPEVFTSKAVFFQSENQDNVDCILKEPIKVTGTANTTTVRLIRTNKDKNDTQDMYSTIIGRTRT